LAHGSPKVPGSAAELLVGCCWDIFYSSQTRYDSHAAVKLGRILFPIFAMALDLSEDFFDDKVLLIIIFRGFAMFHILQTRNAAAIMRVLHYPPQTGPVDDRIIGIGAHTEYAFVLYCVFCRKNQCISCSFEVRFATSRSDPVHG
jgi:hypothetical protein